MDTFLQLSPALGLRNAFLPSRFLFEASVAPVVAISVLATGMPGRAAAPPLDLVVQVIQVAEVMIGHLAFVPVHAAWILLQTATSLDVHVGSLAAVRPFPATTPAPLVVIAVVEPATSGAAVVPLVAIVDIAPAVLVTMVTTAHAGTTQCISGSEAVRTIGCTEETFCSNVLAKVRQVDAWKV